MGNCNCNTCDPAKTQVESEYVTMPKEKLNDKKSKQTDNSNSNNNNNNDENVNNLEN